MGRVLLLLLLLGVELMCFRGVEADSVDTIARLFGPGPLALQDVVRGLPEEAKQGAKEIFARLDRDGSGSVSFDELLLAFPRSAKTEGDDIRQAHLSLGGAGAMWITWVTEDKEGVPFARWGSAANSLPYNASGTTFTYNVGFLGWHKWLHQVEMSGLGVDTKVYYQFGTVGGSVSQVGSFQMPGTATATIAFQGDQGTIEPLGNAVAEQMARDSLATRFDAVHVVGDLAYAWKSAVPGPEEQWIWDLYCQEQTVYSTRVPHMTTIGNHEQFSNATSYAARYRMPGPESGGNLSFYYSYNVGPVHVIAFTTDGPPDHSPGSPQYVWLQHDLQSVNRSVTPWVIFTTHRPLFCSARAEFGQHAGEEAILEPLLLAGKVDLVVVGHVHVYERIYPNIKGVPVVGTNTTNVWRNPGAPAYVVQGTGGCLLNFGTSDRVWKNPAPVWSAKRARHYGYGLMTANSTVLHYAFKLEADNSVFDEFWISK